MDPTEGHAWGNEAGLADGGVDSTWTARGGRCGTGQGLQWSYCVPTSVLATCLARERMWVLLLATCWGSAGGVVYRGGGGRLCCSSVCFLCPGDVGSFVLKLVGGLEGQKWPSDWVEELREADRQKEKTFRCSAGQCGVREVLAVCVGGSPAHLQHPVAGRRRRSPWPST